MKTILTGLFSLLVLVTFTPLAGAEEGDAEGCEGSPLFNRLPNYLITECDERDFNYYEFPVTDDSMRSVEGKYWMVDYYVKEGAKPSSPLATVRNFKAAIEKGGGKVVLINDTDWPRVSGYFTKNGAETWVYVMPRDLVYGYTIYIVEQEEMKQEITSNVMMDSLNATGRIALAITFDTGKSTIKDESQPILEQMVDLMKNNPELKVEIQGHTDNVGKADANLKLSDERAQAVMRVLLDHEIAADRMTAKGYGDTRPVADNATDEGKAKNRRVELVKK
ncbi:OmpA family protein [bacterium]|nr:OmpA family protein [bacterium]